MKKIGKYEVRGLLGRGGMGAVYKVKLPVIGKILALKLLAPKPELVGLLGYDEILKRFSAEAVTMGRLRHPNIAAVCDYEASPHTFLVMEYYCQNLGARIGETYDLEAPSRRLPIDRALSYTRQTLLGLQRLHRAGIIHRDIKPFNLLLTDEDTVKITDFGLSRLRGETFQGPKNLHVGSPYYTAPEQEKDPDLAGPESDLYSVGVMLYRFLTGMLPLDGAKGLPDEPLGLGDAGDVFLEKALAPRREDRFKSAKEMMRDLDGLEAVWRKKQEQVCRLTPPRANFKKDAARGRSPRRNPIKAVPGEARERFGLDELWRPQHDGAPNFQITDHLTVRDDATHLTWQREGSEFRLTWPEAHQYIERLNHEKWAGYNDWRLPTIDELISILGPGGSEDEYCLDPVFDPDKVDLWSADDRSVMAAWYVNTTSAYVGRQDKTCYFGVRAVR